jgi:hypothetical protein
MAVAATAFRYSAPCAQPGFGIEGSERRGGFLRRSGAPIQSLLSAADNSVLDPGFRRPRPIRRVNPPAQTDLQEVPKWKGHSFWRLASQPIMEFTIPNEAHRGEEMPAMGEATFPGPRSGGRLSQMATNESQPVSAAFVRPRVDTEPQYVLSVGTVEDWGGARLEALHTLEGTRLGLGHAGARAELGDHTVDVRGSGEEKPISMCGDRLYSDWQGDWGRSRSLQVTAPAPNPCGH